MNSWMNDQKISIRQRNGGNLLANTFCLGTFAAHEDRHICTQR